MARDQIAAIARDFVDAWEAGKGWPTHPLDDEQRRPRRTAYCGEAGGITSLCILRGYGFDAPDLTKAIPGVLARYRQSPDFGWQTGLQLGVVGILSAAVLANPEAAALADELYEAMQQTVGHRAHEITKGETGALHAAAAVHLATGEARWREVQVALAESLWKCWAQQEDTGTWLLEHRIFGGMRRYFGACHGVAGNAGALARSAACLPDGWGAEALRRAACALQQGALRHGADLNWPVSPDPSGGRRLLQWCHGAPGVITSLATAPGADAETEGMLDELLHPAAETVWRAGPLTKGPGLCHGNAGNGYAMLEMFRRTGDARWLERARAFAMHGIQQWAEQSAHFGQGRYTLWTGDGGFAVFLQHCIEPELASIPGLDLFA